MTQSVSAAAAVAVRHVSAYLDLLQSDLEIGIQLARSRLIAVCVMSAALLMAVALLCGWIVAVAWNTPQRSWVVAGLIGVLVVIAIAAFWRICALRSAPSLLSQTARELSNDRSLLMAFLERDRDLSQ
jgi:uncharacterized membrane protein YqjE